MATIEEIECSVKELAQNNSHLPLNDQLASIRNYFMKEVFPAQTVVDIQEALETLAKSNISDNFPRVGDLGPCFFLPNAKGETIRLVEILKKGPAVVVFYRGAWCPYCNLHLNALQKILPQIKELGAMLVAISPQTPDHSISQIERNNLAFEVLSDLGNKVAKEFGLMYKLPSKIIQLYDSFGVSLSEFNGDDLNELPVSGTFVIGQDQRVVWAYADVDYTKRAEPVDIIAALKQLKH